MMPSTTSGSAMTRIHGGDVLLTGIILVGIMIYITIILYCCNKYLSQEEPDSSPYSSDSDEGIPECIELDEFDSTDTQRTITADIPPRYEVVGSSDTNTARSAIYTGGPLRFENETQV